MSVLSNLLSEGRWNKDVDQPLTSIPMLSPGRKHCIIICILDIQGWKQAQPQTNQQTNQPAANHTK